MKYNKVGDLCRCQITGLGGRGPWSLCCKWVYYFISNGTPFKHEMNEMKFTFEDALSGSRWKVDCLQQ